MKNLSLLLLILLVVFSCKKDSDDSIMDPESNLPVSSILEDYHPSIKIVKGSILGSITDEANRPIADATIRHQGKEYSSDENGFFIIRDENLNANGTFFTVEKAGFFKGSRGFYPIEGSFNYTYIQLLALDEIGQFNAIAGGEVFGSGNFKIAFPSNSIQSENGALYTEQVSVFAKKLNPVASNIDKIMPGDLTGVNTEVQEVSLESYGMMAVELFGENGEKLNLASGSEATLSFPIPNILLSNAPQEIQLWSFEDDQFGIWVEEGKATLEGEFYVGNVSHFSFWNCDIPLLYIKVSGQLVDSNGVPIRNAEVRAQIEGTLGVQTGITDNQGFFCGFMPRNEQLTLTAGYGDGDCGFANFSFGPFSDPNEDKADIGTIALADEERGFTVFGSVLDCNNNPVSNGLVQVQLGITTRSMILDSDGNFSIAMMNCNDLEFIRIVGFDFETLERGEPITKLITPSINCGTLIACGNADCLIPDDRFSGSYLISIEDNEGLGYGPAYESGQSVNIVPEGGLGNFRKFNSELLPDIGPFMGTTTFENYL